MALFNLLDLNCTRLASTFYLILPHYPMDISRQKKRPKEVNPRVCDILFKGFARMPMVY